MAPLSYLTKTKLMRGIGKLIHSNGVDEDYHFSDNLGQANEAFQSLVTFMLRGSCAPHKSTPLKCVNPNVQGFITESYNNRVKRSF